MTSGSFGWKKDRVRQHSLYPGQREALTRRATGASYQTIGDAMGVTKQTVASYLGGAMVALGSASIEEACREAEQRGLIPFLRDEV
jgi:DNA-binding CsgD family transcriptional regulator